MSFWHEDKPITGNPEDAYTKAFAGNIPNNTMALSRIESVANDDYNGIKTIKIHWVLIDGDYKERHVFQKLKVYDEDSSKRHTAKNMLKLMYNLFNIEPLTDGAPTDQDLMQMVGKVAGIKVQEWYLPKDNGSMASGNYVSEVHPSQGFVSVSGKPMDAPLNTPKYNRPGQMPDGGVLDDDIPF